MRTAAFDRDFALRRNGVNVEGDFSGIQDQLSVPLVQMDIVKKWAERHGDVKGVSPRWFIPV